MSILSASFQWTQFIKCKLILFPKCSIFLWYTRSLIIINWLGFHPPLFVSCSGSLLAQAYSFNMISTERDKHGDLHSLECFLVIMTTIVLCSNVERQSNQLQMLLCINVCYCLLLCYKSRSKCRVHTNGISHFKSYDCCTLLALNCLYTKVLPLLQVVKSISRRLHLLILFFKE